MDGWEVVFISSFVPLLKCGRNSLAYLVVASGIIIELSVARASGFSLPLRLPQLATVERAQAQAQFEETTVGRTWHFSSRPRQLSFLGLTVFFFELLCRPLMLQIL